MTASSPPASDSLPTVTMLVHAIHPVRWTPRVIELALDREALRPSDVVAIQLRRMAAGLPLDEREEATALALRDELPAVRSRWSLDAVRPDQYLELYDLRAHERRVVLAVLLAHLVDSVGYVSLEDEAGSLIDSHGRGGRFEELVPWGLLSRSSRAWLRGRQPSPFRAALREAIDDEARALADLASPPARARSGASTAVSRLARRRLRREVFAMSSALLPADELPSIERGSDDPEVDALVVDVYQLQERIDSQPWRSADPLGRRMRDELIAAADGLAAASASLRLHATAERLRALHQAFDRYDAAATPPPHP